MHKVFNKLMPIINNNFVQPSKNYLSKPIGQITLFNTLLYVLYRVIRSFGTPRMSPQTS